MTIGRVGTDIYLLDNVLGQQLSDNYVKVITLCISFNFRQFDVHLNGLTGDWVTSKLLEITVHTFPVMGSGSEIVADAMVMQKVRRVIF